MSFGEAQSAAPSRASSRVVASKYRPLYSSGVKRRIRLSKSRSDKALRGRSLEGTIASLFAVGVEASARSWRAVGGVNVADDCLDELHEMRRIADVLETAERCRRGTDVLSL